MVDVVVGFIDKGPTPGPERVAGERDVVQLERAASAGRECGLGVSCSGLRVNRKTPWPSRGEDEPAANRPTSRAFTLAGPPTFFEESSDETSTRGVRFAALYYYRY